MKRSICKGSLSIPQHRDDVHLIPSIPLPVRPEVAEYGDNEHHHGDGYADGDQLREQGGDYVHCQQEPQGNSHDRTGNAHETFRHGLLTIVLRQHQRGRTARTSRPPSRRAISARNEQTLLPFNYRCPWQCVERLPRATCSSETNAALARSWSLCSARRTCRSIRACLTRRSTTLRVAALSPSTAPPTVIGTNVPDTIQPITWSPAGRCQPRSRQCPAPPCRRWPAAFPWPWAPGLPAAVPAG